MPLVDDPTVGTSLLVPRGFIPLAGTEEELKPSPPPKPIEEPSPDAMLAPTSADGVTGLLANSLVGSFFQSELGSAALRQSNTVLSAISKFSEVHGVSNDLVDPAYSPWEDVVGTPYEDYWKSTFVRSNNRAYTEALKRSIDRQLQDRRTVEAGGTLGTISGIVAGTIDPTLLIPVGGAISLTGKGVWTVARGALAGARAGGIGAGAYELGLHASQDIRTLEESAFNIGTGVVLGAVVGGTIASALSRTQQVASGEALERLAGEAGHVPGSVGAAAPKYFTLDDLTINGKITENIAAATAFSPNLRGNFRQSPVARKTYQEIATNTLRQNMHEVGESLGASVETNINVSLGETIGQALEKYPSLYEAGKKAAFGMSEDIFDVAVGRAMRRNDIGENEFVSNAAKMFRSQVIDPLTKQAIDLQLLPEDVSVSEAPSYFSRMYNVEKMVARKPEFMAITEEHFNGVLQTQFSKARSALESKKADLLNEKEVLGLSPKKRGKKLAELQALEKSAKIDKLIARLTDADEVKLGDRIVEIEAKLAELDRKFYDQWEIKRLGEGIDLNDPNAVPDFRAHAKDMSQEVYDSITGNDYGSASIDPQFHLAARSGPLKERTFHIPDEAIEDFLEDNVVKVMSRFARTMSAQVELARKFPGDPLLKNRFQEIKREYDELINAATTEKERTKLEKDRKGAFRDLRALLEIHRGNYMAKENASSWGRVVRGTMQFNYLRSMGGAAIPSLGDIYGPAIFHGPLRTMQVGLPNLIKAIQKNSAIVKEAKYAGVAERLSHHRLLTLAEVGDPYAGGTAIERLLDSGTHLASKWNGLNMLTDFQKTFDAIIVQDRMNNALLKGTDDNFLAYSGMNPAMRSKVKKNLEQHMTTEDGITVANTDQWDDFDAVRAYRAAINFNVNADIVTRGIADVPLAAYHPLGKMFLQFKTFSLAAHQRTFLRASQLGPAQFLSGLIGLTTIGLFTITLKALRGGEQNWERFQNSAQNPGYRLAEALDSTGFFTLPLELGNMVEKATLAGGYPIHPIKTPMMLAGKQFVPDASMQANSQRYAGKGVVSALAGPTAGLIESGAIASGIPVDLATGEEIPQSKLNQMNQIVPYGSYIGMREMLQIMQDNSPYVDGE